LTIWGEWALNRQLECQPDIDLIKEADPEIFHVMELELERQTHMLKLIASEKITSRCVMANQGSPLTNKCVEGYSNRRFYPFERTIYQLFEIAYFLGFKKQSSLLCLLPGDNVPPLH
jgi:hypothetical protein